MVLAGGLWSRQVACPCEVSKGELPGERLSIQLLDQIYHCPNDSQGGLPQPEPVSLSDGWRGSQETRRPGPQVGGAEWVGSSVGEAGRRADARGQPGDWRAEGQKLPLGIANLLPQSKIAGVRKPIIRAKGPWDSEAGDMQRARPTGACSVPKETGTPAGRRGEQPAGTGSAWEEHPAHQVRAQTTARRGRLCS